MTESALTLASGISLNSEECMRSIFSIVVLVCLVAGCTPVEVKDVLANLDKDCVRHYAGSVATGTPGAATVTFTIDCKPSGQVAPAPTQ